MLAIEMSDARGVDYHAIHAAGCRDLRDGQPIPGTPATVLAVADSVCEATGYGEDEYDEDDVRLKPCAHDAMRKAAKAAATVEPVQQENRSTDVGDDVPSTYHPGRCYCVVFDRTHHVPGMKQAGRYGATCKGDRVAPHYETRCGACLNGATDYRPTVQPGQVWIRWNHGTEHEVMGPADQVGHWEMRGPAGKLYVTTDARLWSGYVLDLDQ